MTEELVDFFKALADSNRLKIVGLLSHRSYSGEELAALLDLKPSTISHHLSKLVGAGLVTVAADGYYKMYRLDKKALESRSRSLLSSQNISASLTDVDANAYDRKVIADYSRRDGSLKTLPAQRKKLEVILRHVVKSFEGGRKYSEKKVNEILARYHEDVASLRRELVGYGLMKRENGEYWRPSQ